MQGQGSDQEYWQWINQINAAEGEQYRGKGGEFDEITRVDNEINEVDKVNIRGEWEVITFKIDSGAVDNVVPKSVGDSFPIKPTSLSKQGVNYQAANGTPHQEPRTKRHQRVH